MLKVIDLRKSYRSGEYQTDVLHDINLQVNAQQSLSIQGASGCGKSTLLHIIAALDKPDSGQVLIQSQGESFPSDLTLFNEAQKDRYRQSRIGIIFQRYNLIDSISVEDNILLPCRLNHQTDKPHIKMLVEALGIEKHLNKRPNQLSGGEQQRVAIARALAHKPELVLADEPTGNLDEDTSKRVAKLLYDTCYASKASLVLVTHSDAVANLAQIKMRIEHKRLIEC
uniref:ABC transporter ATP-binding protein n=1 Tax=Ningiella ruwaisensis TaxID=2364274 RepID=UPI00109FBD4D|nr:ABC transporter ATP-binding protein [Ningiella ruwaisensis]